MLSDDAFVPLRTSEPVVTLVDPVATRKSVGDEDLHDVLRVLVAEFGWHSELHRITVLSWQLLAVVSKGEESLWMQRGRHVDAFVVVVRAFEANVFVSASLSTR